MASVIIIPHFSFSHEECNLNRVPGPILSRRIASYARGLPWVLLMLLVAPLLYLARYIPKQDGCGHLNPSFSGGLPNCVGLGESDPSSHFESQLSHSAGLRPGLDAPIRAWDAHGNDTEMQGQVRNCQAQKFVTMVVRPCLLLLLLSLLRFLPVFIGWSSCLLVSSVSHQHCFQYLPCF